MDPHAIAGRLRELVAPDFSHETVGHDLSHLDRVWHNCQTLQAAEGGDLTVLAVAAYVHDVHRVLERRTGRSVRPRETHAQVVESLALIEFPAEKQNLVLACVDATGSHSFTADGSAPTQLEPMILGDADNLDALGAVGIARALMFGAHLGEPLWQPDEPIGDVYIPGRASSIIHHFHEKLLRLKDDMHTDTGRALAEERDQFMRSFLHRLMDEAGSATAVLAR